MLKVLKRKFVIITMALVGAVLVSVLGGYYVSAMLEQRRITSESLDLRIEQTQRDYELWGSVYEQFGPRRGPLDNARVTVHVFEVDDEGNVADGYEVPRNLDASTLVSVVKDAMADEADSGWDGSLHVSWKRAQLDDDAWVVVVADTAFADLLLQNMLVRDVVITVVAMGLLLLIVVRLAGWVLRPVEQAWEQQRRFIADASHELKTPLAVIIANTQILSREEGIPAEARRWVDSTADESAHMKNLVEELLELARTDESSAGAQGIMKRELVDFSAMVANAALEFDAIAFERGTSIDERVEEGISVVGDAEWLGRLCKILIDNACKYSTGAVPVVVRLAREGKRCVFEVNNHGNVIDAADLGHVFDRFYRTDKARSREAGTGGFGLGLAIAKGIATSHGGDISVASSEDAGTTFSVWLPCA